jgi:hypothetical protein
VSCLVHYRQRLSIRHGGKPFQGRDEGALRGPLTVLLTGRSFGRRFLLSDAIFNDPSNLPLSEQEANARSRFTRQDLLIRTTRFGMDDWHPSHARQRRKVEMSGNYIEGCFVNDWRRYFRHLSRTEIELTPEAAEVLPPGAQTHFYLTDGDDAAYGTLASDGIVRKRRGGIVTSPGFMIYARELWDDGPAGLSIFGMSGSVTYGFCHLIEHRFPAELAFADFEFVYCELSCDGPLIPGNEPPDAAFTRNWTVTIRRRGCEALVYGPEPSSALQPPASLRAL